MSTEYLCVEIPNRADLLGSGIQAESSHGEDNS